MLAEFYAVANGDTTAAIKFKSGSQTAATIRIVLPTPRVVAYDYTRF